MEEMTLSKLELEALRRYIGWCDESCCPPLNTDDEQQQAEWAKKATWLGLRVI
jgi:hypothetical protein